MIGLLVEYLQKNGIEFCIPCSNVIRIGRCSIIFGSETFNVDIGTTSNFGNTSGYHHNIEYPDISNPSFTPEFFADKIFRIARDIEKIRSMIG